MMKGQIQVGRPRRSPAAQSGFTLTELMVVIAIIGILGLIAVPAMTRDTSERDLRDVIEKFVQDVRRGHLEAISSREERAILINGSGWQLTMVTPGASGAVHSQLASTSAPSGVVIASFQNINALPEVNYTRPTATAPIARMTTQREIRFRYTGEADGNPGTSNLDSVTVFFATESGNSKARVVITGATSFVKYFDRW